MEAVFLGGGFNMNSKLSFFMKEELKNDEIIEIPGVDTFKDENGKIIPFKIRYLSTKEIADIRKYYTNKKIAMDKKGKPIIVNGEIVYQTDSDWESATDRLIVESFVYPNLKDPDLMQFYDCVDVCDMPRKIFKKPADYSYVSEKVMEIIGIIDSTDDEIIDEVKKLITGGEDIEFYWAHVLWQRHGLRMEEFEKMDIYKKLAYIASELVEDESPVKSINRFLKGGSDNVCRSN